MEPVYWKDLQVGGEYYVETTAHNHPRQEITVTYIQYLNDDEAMIHADQGRGFAVGGIFEGPIGPHNRFWYRTEAPSYAKDLDARECDDPINPIDKQQCQR